MYEHLPNDWETFRRMRRIYHLGTAISLVGVAMVWVAMLFNAPILVAIGFFPALFVSLPMVVYSANYLKTLAMSSMWSEVLRRVA